MTPGREHVQALATVLPALDTDRLHAWARILADRLPAGRRLPVAGNGRSAAEARHLTSEMGGRFHSERPPPSAIAQHADSSSGTAIANDHGTEEVFARQVGAHGRPATSCCSRPPGPTRKFSATTPVRRLKGPDRPVVADHERAALTEALDCVDGVLVFAEDTPERVLAELRPDIRVKGDDHAGRRISEAGLAEGRGGEAIVVPYLNGHFTNPFVIRLTQQAGTP